MALPTDQKITSATRIIDAVMGALFVAIAIVILAGSFDPGVCAAALALGGLGIEAIIAALRHRRSWLARIGPLP